MENFFSESTQALAGSSAAPVVSQTTSLIVWFLLPLPAAETRTFLQALSQPKIDRNEKSQQCHSKDVATSLNGREEKIVKVDVLLLLLQ